MSASHHQMTGHPRELPALRPWQAACIDQALATLSPSHAHFLCQATPGAGKMLMAAVLTRELMARGDIDYVLYLGPTASVVERAAETLAQVTGKAMHGRLGASGTALTYQALRNCLEELQRLGRDARVLLIWDESHHAAGHADARESANQWGMALMALERQVRFTLALSGTPWRTDGSCLPLLRYLDTPVDDAPADDAATPPPRQQLQPDFIYTLTQAIQDGVCRHPRLQLIDNRSIRLTRYHARSGRRETRRFTSIPHLLKHPAMHYGSLLRHDEPMRHLLDLGCEQLACLRQGDMDAAGLVVASDIVHAEAIAEALEDRQQSVCLVTSKAPNAHARLHAFRDDSTQWIVSVGMVSEGVDIPRLRVCCYLSHIRTEQHFRQVLGRIIRRQGNDDADCFLYALNEPHLRRYARRVADDLPEDLATVSFPMPETASDPAAPTANRAPTPSLTPQDAAPLDDSAEAARARQEGETSTQLALDTAGSAEQLDPDVAFSRAFFERLVALRLLS
ncbi:DEAD/DEAH box helicase family protein [Halomonas daqiaonensis]|uniref:Superfamily II DNA or RNA helicase n=1 Tax=Halomonas daqiaonensis TaxID=650850 RepID=A0A1H7GK11_9GAMM|nr:DEAD/DEAH box helicase family protein [Halomonas daqiaonensis]SEK38513.1 Superfamily II DNA or RNA helicase [Halomonas daqiaonensis]